MFKKVAASAVFVLMAMAAAGRGTEIPLDRHSNFIRAYGIVIKPLQTDPGTGQAKVLISIRSAIPDLQGSEMLFYSVDAAANDLSGLAQLEIGRWVVIEGNARTFFSCDFFCDNPTRLYAVDVYRWDWEANAWEYFDHVTRQWRPW